MRICLGIVIRIEQNLEASAQACSCWLCSPSAPPLGSTHLAMFLRLRVPGTVPSFLRFATRVLGHPFFHLTVEQVAHVNRSEERVMDLSWQLL